MKDALNEATWRRRIMKKPGRRIFSLLVILAAGILLTSTQAFAEANDTGAEDGSDCGCSESGLGISANDLSGQGAGYGTRTGDAADGEQQEGQSIQNDGNDSINLIWVNLISIAVVAGIVVMLIRYRKSVKSEKKDEKDKEIKDGFVIRKDRSNK